MTNCVLLPFKAPDGSYKINVMHCVFPEHYDTTEWAPRATEVIGTDDVEFCSSWKRFDPWMAWARLSYLKDVIHHYVLCRIPIFGEFLAVNSEEEFVTLIGKHPDCTYGFLMIEKFPNGFVLIPYLLKLFNIHSGVDPHKLGYKIVLWINAELKKRKDSSINNDTGVGFKYLYKLLVWLWAVKQGYGHHVKITENTPFTQENSIMTNDHLLKSIRLAKKHCRVPEWRVWPLVQGGNFKRSKLGDSQRLEEEVMKNNPNPTTMEEEMNKKKREAETK